MTDDAEILSVSEIYKAGDFLQIHTQSLNEDILFSRHSADPGVRVYKYYADGTFSRYFDFAAGVACMQAQELTSLGTRTGIARVMDPDQLIRMARELLTDAN